jgi:hypothetical protein
MAYLMAYPHGLKMQMSDLECFPHDLVREE